ncbi:PIN domain-containing protein [Microbacterium sp. CJ88]|uniref:PIN domain-containing protein n=1 Tax=Microbacterium sp. CJ88 TaxID=3445672 RepID=UPI003F659D79
MVRLISGVRAQQAAQHLWTAKSAGEDLLGSEQSFRAPVTSYVEWVYQHAEVLRSVIEIEDVQDLFFTADFDRAQVAPDLSQRATHDAVAHAIRMTVQRLDDARQSLEKATGIWRNRATVVLDTNVLLQHIQELADIPWAKALDWDRDQPIALGIPLVVVAELDGLKASNASHVAADGTKTPLRTLARNALRTLSVWFAGPHVIHELHQDRLYAVLMMDDLRHVRLPSNDAEIVDRALQVRPFVRDLAVASDDVALRFQAAKLGLPAFSPTGD